MKETAQPLATDTTGVPPGPAPPEVHVWTLALDADPGVAAAALATLPADDRRRAERMLAGPVRERWTMARAGMREVLAGYVDVPARELAFVDSGHGKPALAPGCDGGGLRFNLSHAGGVGLLAVTRVGAIGVDVERVCELDDLPAIARRCFAPCERERLQGLRAPQRTRAFFECWTRKEALLKAIGLGLGGAMHEVAVSFADGAPARLLRGNEHTGDPATWWLQALAVPQGYVAAVAVHAKAPLELVRRVGAGAESLSQGTPRSRR